MPRKDNDGSTRTVVYKEIVAKVCRGETAITAEQARELLGWTEVQGDGLFKDRNGKSVRCLNNVTNRPLYRAVVETLKQEHLRRRWQFNGEPLIIGRTALVLNGQHSLISLVLAVQEWLADQGRWPGWETEPTMDKLIIYGVSEDDDTVNTMDTCKPRTLADVIYRSEFFTAAKEGDRKKAARMLDYAIRLLWHRTGAGIDAFAPRRTHAESLHFFNQHPRLLEAIRHVYEEDDEGQLRKYLGPGYLAALLYLMGAAKTDPAAYHSSDTPDESLLDFGLWSKACDFVVLLAGGGEQVQPLVDALTRMINDGGGSIHQRCALLAKAWQCYAEDGPVTTKGLTLSYVTDEHGMKKLGECPTVGGIDLGDPTEAKEPVRHDPRPEEIKERAKAVRQQNEERRKEAPAPAAPVKKKLKKKGPSGSRVGKVYWVASPGEEPWQGRVVEVQGRVARVTVQQGHQGAGNVRVVPLAQLSSNQPIAD